MPSPELHREWCQVSQFGSGDGSCCQRGRPIAFLRYDWA